MYQFYKQKWWDRKHRARFIGSRDMLREINLGLIMVCMVPCLTWGAFMMKVMVGKNCSLESILLSLLAPELS